MNYLNPNQSRRTTTRRRSRECISLPSEFLQMPPFRKILRDRVQTIPGNMHVKYEVRRFNHLELLAYNAQKFRGSRDPGHAPFSKTFKGSCPDCFDRSAAHTQTDTHRTKTLSLPFTSFTWQR